MRVPSWGSSTSRFRNNATQITKVASFSACCVDWRQLRVSLPLKSSSRFVAITGSWAGVLHKSVKFKAEDFRLEGPEN